MQIEVWTYEQMTINPAAGMVVTWPRVPTGLTDGGTSDRLREIRGWFDDARAYEKSREHNDRQQTDLKLEALLPVLKGDVPLIVRADALPTIQSAVAFAADQKVRIVIFGGYDAPLCAELLKKHDVPVIISAVYRLPRRQDDPFDAAYSLPSRLKEAGVRFCISGSDSSRTSNVRNLPYHAATAVAYGLPEDDALRAITLSPAEILGVSDQVGSLEAGKDATLIVTTGDPLDTFTAVSAAWIQGRAVDLSTRHTLLNEKYQEKYRQLKAAE
jgi:imidazolonepropionase-like amidohydrolase